MSALYLDGGYIRERKSKCYVAALHEGAAPYKAVLLAAPELLEALTIARKQIATDRESLFAGVVNQHSGAVDDAEDQAAVGAYDQTLAFIDAALAKATTP